jgi:hypothetical protein
MDRLLWRKGVFTLTLALVFPILVIIFLFFAEVTFFAISYGILNKAFSKAVGLANSNQPITAFENTRAILGVPKEVPDPGDSGQDALSSFVSFLTKATTVNLPEDFFPIFQQQLQSKLEETNGDRFELCPVDARDTLTDLLTSSVRYRIFLAVFFSLMRQQPLTNYLGRFCSSGLPDENSTESCVVCLSFVDSSQGVRCHGEENQLRFACFLRRPSLLGLNVLWARQNPLLLLVSPAQN